MPTHTPPHSAGSSAKSRQFPCFDGLRAFAATSVLVYHAANDSGFAARSGAGLYTTRLDLGVSVFFLISGFLLYRPFARAHLAGRRSPATGRFWGRRLLRIVPAYWLALTVIVYVLNAARIPGGWHAVLAVYGFAQVYFPSHYSSGIPQAWSLCTEMSFYLFLPLYAAAIGMRRRSAESQLRRELVGVGVLVIAGILFKTWVLNHHCAPNCFTSLVTYTIAWLPFYFDLFALGMLLAVLSAWYSEHRAEPAWLAHRATPWVSWGCAALLFVVVSHVGDPRAGTLSPVPGIVTRFLYGLFAFFLLLPAVFGPQEQGLVRRLLSAWPVAAVGVVSYGVYLWHGAWITEVFRWAGHHGWSSPASFIILTVFVLTLSVGSSAASYLAVERPILRLKDGGRPWHRSRVAQSGDAVTPATSNSASG